MIHFETFSGPTLVANGRCDQKMDHLLGLINSETETKQLKLTPPFIKYTTIFYGVSCAQTWRNASKSHAKVLSDPILVANGCCDQKLEHLPSLTNSKV
jgi:hypothetical protein